MICKWCNKENPNNNQFCMYCGQKLTEEVNNNYNNQNNFQTQTFEKKANVWLAILSWFIPLAGLIIFIVKREKDPKTAKASGICALISFLLSIVMLIITFLITAYVINNSLDNIRDSIEDNWNNIEDNQGYLDDYYNNNYIEDNQDTNDNSINETDTTNITNNWKEYKVTVNEKTLTLPTTFNELNNVVTFSLKSADTKSYLEKGYYTLVNMYKNDKLALYIEVLNDSEEDKLYTDCKITRITQTKYQVSQGADVFTFPGNLKVGDKITKTKITELLGTPSDIKEYSSEGYEKITYKYFENSTWTTTNNYEITVVNGIIDELQLDNRK